MRLSIFGSTVAIAGALVAACGSNAPSRPSIVDVNGGLTGSGTVGSVFVVDGSGFGNLAAAAPGYSLDFRDATDAVVASAAVDYAAAGWQDVVIAGTVPAGLSTSISYTVTVTTPSGTSQPVPFVVLPNVTFSPSTISWATTASLPVALQGFPAVIAPVAGTSYLFALGGNTATAATANGKASNVASVYFAALDDSTGALVGSSWSTTSPLPAARGFAAAVVANALNSRVSGNGTIYVLGGLDSSGAASSTIWAASLNVNGTIFPTGAGSWTPVASLPQPLFAHAATIVHGRMYVAGGNDSTGNPVDTVYSAAVNNDGSLGSWTVLPTLPVKLAYHQLVADAGNLYVLGGDTAAADPITNVEGSTTSAVYRAAIDVQDGSLVGGAWTTNASPLSKAREKGTVIATGGYLLVSGGLYNGALTGSSEESYAALAADGSVGSFNGATGVHTITGTAGGYDFFNHAAAVFVDANGRPHVLVLGGQDVNSGALHAEVWYQP
jgi:hypothetical protein